MGDAMTDRKTAFVTGASRGIGKAIAVSLAKAGFDVAITARTVEPGEGREHSSTIAASDTSPLPGSLSETAELVEACGVQSMMLPADLIDRASLGLAAGTLIERWGRVDVLVHNARFVGPGHMDTLMGAPIDAIENHMQGNFFAPLVLNKLLLPTMMSQGSGLIINLSSGAGISDPPAMAGKGGWGISYGASKGAFNRVAGILALELEEHNIKVLNLEPGYIVTERITQDMAGFGFGTDGSPPEIIGAVAAHLATHPDEVESYNGKTLDGQPYCFDNDLVPGWRGPGFPL
jgi:NAD(P)-dependent dehydrogenase (short-subunit alcohol dehydrogenase family)